MTSECFGCGIELDCGDSTYRDVLGFMWHQGCWFDNHYEEAVISDKQ